MITTQPTDKRRRVYRGGSWYYTSASIVRATYRLDKTPLLRSDNLGFRCAQRGCRQQILKVTP